MIPFSVLDLAPINEGSDAAQSFRNTLDLAQKAEGLGYQRYWLAEHHGMPGIASAATAVLIAHVAGGTRTIRVGAGGVMLPNHSPLVIAEQFGTLESLFPGRIDLGLGRAPGSDRATSRALRRSLETDADEFPQDVVELMDYFAPDTHGSQETSRNAAVSSRSAPFAFASATPVRRVQAIPGVGLQVPIWILGSSLFGAQLAAELGLPYAFASHFAPAQMHDAVAVYRRNFKPSARLAKPYLMLGFNVIAADTDAEAQFLATSLRQAVVNLRSGRPSRLQPPVHDYERRLAPGEAALFEQMFACAAIGSPETVRETVRRFIAETQPDELMVSAQIFDHVARCRSYEILANIRANELI